jgi:cytochrome P450
LRVLFEELLLRLDDVKLLEPSVTPPRRRGNFVLGIESLPIRFTAAPRRV